MKCNYDLIKNILSFIENDDEANGQSTFILEYEEMATHFSNYTPEQVNYHFQLLNDDHLIRGYKESFHNPSYKSLTAEGHRVLEAMQNDKLWNKIKGGAVSAGISGLKQIPALAMQFLLSEVTA